MFDGGGEPSSALEAISKTTSLTSSIEETLDSKTSVQEDVQQPQEAEITPARPETDEADQFGPKRSQAREQEQDILLAQSEVKERTLDDCCCTEEDQLWTQERKRKREEEEEGETEVADAVDNGNSCTVDLVLTLNAKDVLSETQQQQKQKQDDAEEEEKEKEDPKEVLQQDDSESSPSHPVALPEPSRLDVFGIVGVSSWEEEQVEVNKEELVERLPSEHEEEEEEEADDDDDIVGMDYTDMTVFI